MPEYFKDQTFRYALAVWVLVDTAPGVTKDHFPRAISCSVTNETMAVLPTVVGSALSSDSQGDVLTDNQEIVAKPVLDLHHGRHRKIYLIDKFIFVYLDR